MRTYKLNVTELDPGESIVIQFGNHRVEVEAIADDSESYIEVRVPSGHRISNLVQNPLWPNEVEVYFASPEWDDFLQEVAGPIRFITFIKS